MKFNPELKTLINDPARADTASLQIQSDGVTTSAATQLGCLISVCLLVGVAHVHVRVLTGIHV